jgi:hypothetical protein
MNIASAGSLHDPEGEDESVLGRRSSYGMLCQNEVVADVRHRRSSVDQIIRIEMDTSKHLFQSHGVNAAEEPTLRKKLRHKDMVAFFTKLPPTLVRIEARGGSHHPMHGRIGPLSMIVAEASGCWRAACRHCPAPCRQASLPVHEH